MPKLAEGQHYQRRRFIDMPCDYDLCGKMFKATRYDTRYCSAKCRQAACRARKNPDPISVTEAPSAKILREDWDL